MSIPAQITDDVKRVMRTVAREYDPDYFLDILQMGVFLGLQPREVITCLVIASNFGYIRGRIVREGPFEHYLEVHSLDYENVMRL